MGGKSGICLYDNKFYYSVFFGYSAGQRARRGLPAENNGLTACLDPRTGDVLWQTTDYYVTAKCTLSARDGQLYIGGYNRAKEGTDDRFVWCLNADDGTLVWKSDPVTSALNVVSVGEPICRRPAALWYRKQRDPTSSPSVAPFPFALFVPFCDPSTSHGN